MSLEMFTTYDIATSVKSSCNENEKIRLQALLLVKNGVSVTQVSESLLVHRSTVYRWIKRAENEGLFSLKCKSGRGSKSFLTSEQVSELKSAISKPLPTDDGYSRGWQTKDALQFVKENFGVSYSKSRMRQIIKNLGFSKIACRPRSKRRNETLASSFITEVQKKIT
jgi:transposase